MTAKLLPYEDNSDDSIQRNEHLSALSERLETIVAGIIYETFSETAQITNEMASVNASKSIMCLLTTELRPDLKYLFCKDHISQQFSTDLSRFNISKKT